MRIQATSDNRYHATLAVLGLLVCVIRSRMNEASEIDERKGWQWIASAKSYLDYRSGSVWRPARHRFHPEHEYFVRGINLLNQVNSRIMEEVCPCVYCRTGQPFYDAKKPVASVKADKSEKREA